MIVCVDVGNTSIKIAAVADGRVVARAGVPTHGAGDGSIGDAVASVVGWANAAATVVAVASVVPDATARVLSELPGSMPVHVVSHRDTMPIGIDVAEPGRVGTDRLCAAAGAVDDHDPDAIVVDVGTAVTVDEVRGRVFRGGVIMPGPAVMLEALAARARQLPSLALGSLQTLFPDTMRSTADAMAIGAGMSCLGGILESVRHIQRLSPRPAPVWVTGGGVRWVEARLPADWRVDPNLGLIGLYRIACQNLPPGR